MNSGLKTYTQTHKHIHIVKENKTNDPNSIFLIPSQMNFPHIGYPLYINRITIFPGTEVQVIPSEEDYQSDVDSSGWTPTQPTEAT